MEEFHDEDEGYHEDAVWEDPILNEGDWEDGFQSDGEDLDQSDDLPPTVSEEELEERDKEAATDELNKLKSLQVVKEIRKEECVAQKESS